MKLPRTLARFNRRVTNNVFAPLAGRLPPWILLEHVGRRSGQRYRTVIMGFPRGPEMVIALTYGPSTDWVRNVLAAGGCRVKWAGRWRSYTQVELVLGPAGTALLPPVLRPLMRLARLSGVLRLG